MPNLTVNIAPELLRQAKLYAAQNNTTLSNIVRSKLLDVTKSQRTVIEKYTEGAISSTEAQQALGLKTKQEFFRAVCKSGKPLYHINRDKADQQAHEALVLCGLR